MIHNPVVNLVRDHHDRHRRGATLVEVLMALLVMAIGVTSVFTLFPLSILRSIKASQLTNAKLVAENAREVILANPQLVTGAPPWTASTTYGSRPAYTPFGIGGQTSNCWVTPTPRPGRLLPETNLLYYTPNQTGVSGAFEPKWRNGVVNWTGAQVATNRGGYRNFTYITYPPTGGALFPLPIYDGTLNDTSSSRAWYGYRHSRYEPDPRWSAYVVDPLGWWEMDGQGISAAYRDRLGALDRIHCQLPLDKARELFASQDSWQQVLSSIIPSNISFPAAGQVRLTLNIPTELEIDIQRLRTPSVIPEPRVVLLSEDGRRAYGLTVNTNVVVNASLAPNEIQVNGTLPSDFDEIKPADPLNGILGEISTVRIDTYQQRYTWLMTVHLGPRGEAQIDCIIFHNRSFNPLDEEPVAAEFHGPNASGTYRQDQAMITWPASRAAGNPPVKEGGYIYDSNNAHWYRIQKIESINNTSLTTRSAVLTLNTSVTVTTSQEVTPDYDGQAILFPNIVSVFHLDLE